MQVFASNSMLDETVLSKKETQQTQLKTSKQNQTNKETPTPQQPKFWHRRFLSIMINIKEYFL